MDTAPHYSFVQEGHSFHIAVNLNENKPSLQSMQQEAKKNSLMGIAYINELAKLGNTTAKNYSKLYGGYREFVSNHDKKAFLALARAILKDETAGPSEKESARYIEDLLRGNNIHCHKKVPLISYLAPSIEKTITMSPPKIIVDRQVVNVPEMKASHNAFPDLVKYRGDYYAAFREGKEHGGYQDFGKIRILKGNYNPNLHSWKWQQQGLLELKGYDLRDPKFFVDNNEHLHIMVDASIINSDNETAKMVPHVAHLNEGTWSLHQANVDPKANSKTGQWIWKITWNAGENAGYGFSYGNGDILHLMQTKDSITFNSVAEFSCKALKGQALTEATINFKKDGMAVAFIRTQKNGLIATSSLSTHYTKWDCHVIPFRVGGPTFAFTRDQNEMWAATRFYFLKSDNTLDEGTIIGYMDNTHLVPLLRLPSQGDSSYPGIVMEDNNEMTVLYYASEPNGNAYIYITRLAYPRNDQLGCMSGEREGVVPPAHHPRCR